MKWYQIEGYLVYYQGKATNPYNYEMKLGECQMYRCDWRVYLVDAGSGEQCGWKSCRSDRTKKENIDNKTLKSGPVSEKPLFVHF